MAVRKHGERRAARVGGVGARLQLLAGRRPGKRHESADGERALHFCVEAGCAAAGFEDEPTVRSAPYQSRSPATSTPVGLSLRSRRRPCTSREWVTPAGRLTGLMSFGGRFTVKPMHE